MRVGLTTFSNELDVLCEEEESGMRPTMTADAILSLHSSHYSEACPSP